MGDYAYAKKADFIHCIFGRANDNGRTALRMYYMQFPDRRMPDNRIFQLYTHLLECHVWGTMNEARHLKNLFYVTPLNSDEDLIARMSEATARGHGSPLIMVTDSWSGRHEFEPSTTERVNINGAATRGLLGTDHVILNHGQVTWTTPELASPSPTTPTVGRFSSRQI
ncbi:hypothetical protein TNCV_2069781 [Trichonephila clavipes]|uniref:Uncharacterized protein n=1 Tax=Trichonephila clavipes TaxID=2585209 RepID=A0A8X6W392_TRICX|nr:hypothetical protein TNCV_2069781 [Trichonephila clavipes]